MRAPAVALALALLSACQIPPTFVTGYQASGSAVTTRLDRTLAVVPLDEQRPPRLYTASGKMFMTYVPLLPWVSLPFERVDETVEILSADIEKHSGRGITTSSLAYVAPPYDQYTYPRSFAQAIATDLGSSGMFREVRFVASEGPDGFDYVLRGAVRETPLRQTASSYCLGIFGVLLWILPLPMQKMSADVTVDLSLTESTSGTVVWTQTLESHVAKYASMYNPGITYGRHGAFGFSMLQTPRDSKVDRSSLFQWHVEALRRAMESARPDLAATLSAGR